MKTILDAETIIGSIGTPYPTTTHVSFDFQASSHAFGAIFKDRDGAFALTITPNNAYIVNEKQVTYINEPINLQIDKWYSAECGIKTDWILNVYVLYVRIWQTKETTRAYMPRRQSKRRMQVAQKKEIQP